MLTPTETSTIEIAGHPVPVVKGGLYDRYRSNPPLSVIAAELPGVDLSWFKGLEKHKVDIGFESYSPNFYYQNSRVTAVYTADLDALRALMPPEVLATASPCKSGQAVAWSRLLHTPMSIVITTPITKWPCRSLPTSQAKPIWARSH